MVAACAARSSSGLGHRPLKAEIRGSNPLRATTPTRSPGHPRDRVFVCGEWCDGGARGSVEQGPGSVSRSRLVDRLPAPVPEEIVEALGGEVGFDGPQQGDDPLAGVEGAGANL